MALIRRFLTGLKKIKMKKLVIASACFILLVLLFKGCFKKPVKEETPARPVETRMSVVKDVPIYLESFGNLFAPSSVDIKAQATGQIKEAHFEEGKELKKGDMLFTIDPAPYQAELDKQEAMLAQDKAALELQKNTLERNRVLFEKGLISKQDFEQLATDLVEAEARVKMDESGVVSAKLNLDYCFITSPIDGLAGARQVDPGNIVQANSGPVLVNIKEIDHLSIHFTIPETGLFKVRKAMFDNKLKVQVYVEGDSSSPYEGELKYIDNTVDNTSGTAMLHASVANDSRNLWPGQFVKIRLILGEEKGAVLVPYEAVQLGQKGDYLFVVTADSKADLRQVTTGSLQEDYIVIEKGVKEGEKVVVSGSMALSPGASVVEIKPDTAPKPSSSKNGKKSNKR